MLLNGEIYYGKQDKGIYAYTDKGKLKIEFDPKRFRPADVPILLSDINKIKKLGFRITYSVKDIIDDQLNYFLKKENRTNQ